MAHFFQTDTLIICTCGSLRPITKLYFCRHCITLRCGYCITCEVDGIFCSNCLENFATSEAKLKKNRCGSCFECPNCFHALSIRAAISKIASVAGTDGNQPPAKTSKSYYLSCYFCQWSSRDVKIPDQQTSNSSNWPEHDNPNTPRIASLIEYYKVIVTKERLEKEKKTFHLPKRGYQHFTEKYGITAMVARKRAGLPHISIGRDEPPLPEIKPSIASEEVEPLPADIFTKPVDVSNITSLRQRYVIPDLQAESINELFPVHKHLFTKRALRCRSCSHYIFKPEYSPGSIKFKIYLAAYYYVPEIKLLKKHSLKPGEQTEVSLKLCNPAQTPTTVQFLQVNNTDELNINIQNYNEQLAEESDYVKKSSIGQKKIFPLEKPRPVVIKITGCINPLDVTINLPARDDTAEYDDNIDSGQYQDDPKIVVWRKTNKVVFKIQVTADKNLQPGDDVRVCLLMRYTYYDKLMSAVEQKEGRIVNIDVKYILNVGSVENTE